MRLVYCLVITLAGLALVSLAGCNTSNDPPPPPTFKVQGKVVTKSGKPFTGGGQIDFRSIKDAPEGSVGTIQEDGSFTLKTIVGGKSIEGAREGAHKVTIIAPPSGANANETKVYTLQKPYIIQSGDNPNLVVTLE